MRSLLKTLAASAALAISVTGAANASTFLGEFWDATSPVSNLATARAVIAGGAPTATFTSTAIDYIPGRPNTVSSFNTLNRFLGGDSASLSGAGSTTLRRSVFRFSGVLDLAAGQHIVSVASDDGFNLTFGNATFIEYTSTRRFSTTSGTYTAAGGPVAFDLIFFNNWGQSGIEFRIDKTIVTDALAAATVPLPAAMPLLAAGLGSFWVIRRRRKATT